MIKKIEKFFDSFAKSLEKSSLKSGYKPNKIMNPYLKRILKKNYNILDIGVGTGLSSREFINWGFEVTGVDISNKILKEASKYKYKQLIKQDLTKKLNFKKESYELIIAYGVFDFFKKLDNLFKEVNRILKPEGYFSFTIIKSQKPINSKGTYVHTKNEIDNLIKKYHFKIIKEYCFLGYKLKNYSTIYYGFILRKIA